LQRRLFNAAQTDFKKKKTNLFLNCLFKLLILQFHEFCLEDSPTLSINSMHKMFLFVFRNEQLHCLQKHTYVLINTSRVSYAKTLRYTTSNCATISWAVLISFLFLKKKKKKENWNNKTEIWCFSNVVRATMYFCFVLNAKQYKTDTNIYF